jgi:hypothetical protein
VTPELAAAVSALEPLLARQSGALRAGDADALPALAAAMRGPLAVLARHAPRGLPEALRPQVEALSAQAATARVLLARRAHVVQESLAALGRSHAGLQEIQQRGVYGQGGGLSAGWRGGAFERA